MQLGGDQVESLAGVDKTRVLLAHGVLQELIAVQDELTDQIHQGVELGDIHSDGAVRHGRGLRLLLRLEHIADRRRLDVVFGNQNLPKLPRITLLLLLQGARDLLRTGLAAFDEQFANTHRFVFRFISCRHAVFRRRYGPRARGRFCDR